MTISDIRIRKTKLKFGKVYVSLIKYRYVNKKLWKIMDDILIVSSSETQQNQHFSLKDYKYTEFSRHCLS